MKGLGYVEKPIGSEVLIDGMKEVKSMLCGDRTMVTNIRSTDMRPLIIVTQ